jgi:protein required for attachment to host cells
MIRKQSGMGVKSLGHIGMARHSETKRSDPKEMASLQFAKTVSDILYKEKQKKGFASLIICAEPHFLGKLKSEMQSSVKKSVTQWIHKDLQKIPTNKLPKFFLPTKTSPISNEHLLRRRA